jgi:small subunit ribosomal protein S4e
MHQKRISMPKNWQLQRKTNKYIVKANPGQKAEFSLPIFLILRDILNLIKNTKEGKIIIKEGNIFVNNKKIISKKFPVGLLDKIYIKKEEKYFTLILDSHGLRVIEISEKDAQTKPTKVIGKRILRGKRIQISCLDGRNFLYDKEIKIGDSILVDLKENKIVKILPLKEGAEAMILSGNHKGKKGKIEKIGGENAIISLDNEKNKVKLNNIYIVN